MSKKRPLNSDQLGDLGETEFKGACNRVKLGCNQVQRDRYGWDAILEFDYASNTASPSLDHRPAPNSCFVQIKTIWADNKMIRVRLSSAEQIAKKPIPSFFVVQRVAEDLKVKDRVLIHLVNEPLAKILARLRQATAERNTEINKEWVNFNVEKIGSVISAEPTALYDGLVSAIGGPAAMSDYVRQKELQIKSLGYGTHAFTATATFDGIKITDLVDGFLGITPLPVSSFQATEIRFGIPLPLPSNGTGKAEITITPTKPTPCKLTVRRNGAEPPAVLTGEFRAPALRDLPKEHFKALVRTQFFDLFLTPEQLCWSVKGAEIDKVSSDIDSWLSYFRLSSLIAEHDAQIRLDVQGLATLELPIVNAQIKMDKKQVCDLVRICTNTKRILDLIGQSDLRFTFTEIMESATDIDMCSVLVDNATSGAFYSVSAETDDDAEKIDRRFGFMFIFPIKEIFVGCSVLTEAELVRRGNQIRISLTAQRFCDIREVSDDADVERFEQGMVQSINLKNIIRYPSRRMREPAERT